MQNHVGFPKSAREEARSKRKNRGIFQGGTHLWGAFPEGASMGCKVQRVCETKKWLVTRNCR